MKIYVASSWRNEARQQEVVRVLRSEGHSVYDFRHPAEGNSGFSWHSCSTPDQLKDPRRFRDEVLTHPIAQRGFALDMMALRESDATVLVLPCGRSAHLELGFAIRAQQRTFVLWDDPISEPELMYLACEVTCLSVEEVVSHLKLSANERIMRRRVGENERAG
jgi:hypothetical protein